LVNGRELASILLRVRGRVGEEVKNVFPFILFSLLEVIKGAVTFDSVRGTVGESEMERPSCIDEFGDVFLVISIVSVPMRFLAEAALRDFDIGLFWGSPQSWSPGMSIPYSESADVNITRPPSTELLELDLSSKYPGDIGSRGISSPVSFKVLYRSKYPPPTAVKRI
jgi:hypothetical protein